MSASFPYNVIIAVLASKYALTTHETRFSCPRSDVLRCVRACAGQTNASPATHAWSARVGARKDAAATAAAAAHAHERERTADDGLVERGEEHRQHEARHDLPNS